MKCSYVALLGVLSGLSVAQILAQTPAIGSNTCNSSTLMGTYELILSGRQVTANGTTTKLFQAVGTANFDGLSKVTFAMTVNTVTTSQLFGMSLTYSGSYSLQSNCLGSISITNGDTATFTIESYNQGGTFALIGSDGTYAYNGSGNQQPATCPSTISGIHEFNATGSTLSGASVSGVLDVNGILNFDGQGNVTANWTQVGNLNVTTISATGTYTLNSSCQLTATLTDTASNTYTLVASIYSTSPNFSVAVASPQEVFDGSGSATQTTTSAGCSASMLDGTYELILGGRFTPSGVPTAVLLDDGTASFDGIGKVTFNLTSNTVSGTQTFGNQVVYSGSYTLQSNCTGTINLTSGDRATLQMVAYSINATTQQARTFTFVGADASYALNGSGNLQPSACAISTLSGEWPFSATGVSLSGVTDTGVVDVAGLFQFDGQGAVMGNWTQASNAGTSNVSVTGTYTVTPACIGTMTLTDTSSNKYAVSFSILGAAAGNLQMVTANPQLVFSGGARVAFVNPGAAVVNAASFVANSTPAGSVFTIFGSNLATKVSQATQVPLPDTLLTTSVTVNNVAAPLFYADPNQINAQMPENIQPGVATVIVKNGSATSNAVAVTIPATGTPGIVVYGNNRAVVVNQDNSVNSPSSPCKVGDTVVAYFTGGGPVNASNALATGSPSPAGLSPVTGDNSVKVNGVSATVNYMGLTPGSIGLYQANFLVPKVSTGDHPVVITIAGQASNNPLLAVTN